MPQTAAIEVVPVATPADRSRAYAIRRAVFIEEQGVLAEIELDADDAQALHVLALERGEAVGCGRMVEHGNAVKIGRMAVVRDRRGEGIGARILGYLIEAARARGSARAILHAQLSAEGFYLKSGFAPVGEVFEEAGIPHRLMERML